MFLMALTSSRLVAVGDPPRTPQCGAVTGVKATLASVRKAMTSLEAIMKNAKYLIAAIVQRLHGRSTFGPYVW